MKKPFFWVRDVCAIQRWKSSLPDGGIDDVKQGKNLEGSFWFLASGFQVAHN